jgi:hypothetical protein
MTVARLPLAYDIATRDGTLTKDAKIVNAFSETVGQTKHIVKRPGINLLTTLPAFSGSSQGQGMFYYNNQLYVVVANVLYQVNSDGTYNTLGTMAGSQLQCYFNQSLPIPQASNNTVSGNYTFSVAGTYTLPVPTGVYIMFVSTYGAGGGGGQACSGGGDSGCGPGGGSGGYQVSQGMLVTPGTSVTIVVGAGGAANTTNCGTGSTGGSSYVTYSSSNHFISTGGIGGGSTATYGCKTGGVGGTPNGVQAPQACTDPHNQIGCIQGVGGNNGTPYGMGGYGGSIYASQDLQPTNGKDGAVIITY